MEMETESESEEDGQITKYDELEERERRLYGSQNTTSKAANGAAVEDDTPVTVDELNTVRLTRDLLAKHCMAPWFEEYVKGSCLRPWLDCQIKTLVLGYHRCLGSLSHWNGRDLPNIPDMRSRQ